MQPDDKPPHGTPMQCPACYATGHFDEIKTPAPDGGTIAEFKDAIWFNRYDNQGWECHDCWLK